MRRHLAYLRYVLRHKWFVLVAGWHLVLCPLYRLFLHDMSKFRPSEWFPYARNFYEKDGTPKPHTEENEDFQRAWLLHQKRNSHHWQSHVLLEDSGKVIPLDMPAVDILEMLADWAGAGRAITGQKCTTTSWYLKNKDKMQLHPVTREFVEGLLGGVPELFGEFPPEMNETGEVT
jgi:hypothetical protein